MFFPLQVLEECFTRLHVMVVELRRGFSEKHVDEISDLTD